MMTIRASMPGFALLVAGLLSTDGAHAVTMKECGAQYQVAKTSNTLAGQDWNAYRTTHCGAAPAVAATPGATAATTHPAAPTTGPVAAAAAPAAPVATAAKPTGPVEKPGAVAVAPAGPAVFPSKIDPKYASLKAGTGRMKTCDEQYKLNKTTGGNGGMKWIEKGGGYYSACSKHLKGA